ncbi:helix-turn-helix domain-containing protein [Aurantimonas coralicida]|uniref:helix-turn-helix domain-containing protein n=1 Tax=Aurantimonas coralicida TaxID=182270 RepID=UPI0023998556|nr:helix-turn-helix domain-containing protein [Aurantimonas coralicida]MDE0921490.1 helix-turn-helix domain-containing protein [Aurantimonas coralicida]
MNAQSPLLQIEAKRIAAGVSRETLAGHAGVSEKHYRRLLDGDGSPRPGTLAKLRAAAGRLGRASGATDAHSRLVRTCYFAALTLVCQRAGADPAEVRRHDPSRRATGDPAWLQAANLRRHAIVVVNQGLNVAQGEIARALAMTPAAICVAMKAVEDQRDADPDLDAMLDDLTAAMNGGEW